MLAAQLTGRLLPEIPVCDSIRSLISHCDDAAPEHNALVPAYHCMHTPGGPLKFSLEGHPFAVFGFQLTSDSRYLTSISNRLVMLSCYFLSCGSHVLIWSCSCHIFCPVWHVFLLLS